MRAISYMLVMAIPLMGCSNLTDDEKGCIKGKYIANYCTGYVIQVVSKHDVGKEWKSLESGEVFSNCLIAHLDTTVFRHSDYTDPLNTKSDSVFFLQFREGSYPRQHFNICSPEPFVTLTFASPNPCLEGRLD